MEKTTQNNSVTERRFNAYASISFIVVASLIGLPIWWKTTAVYRADLPLDLLDQLKESMIQITLKINLFYLDEDQLNFIDQTLLNLTENQLSKNFDRQLSIVFKFFKQKLDSNALEKLEHQIFTDFDIEINALNFFIIPNRLILNFDPKYQAFLSKTSVCILHQSEKSIDRIGTILHHYFIDFSKIRNIHDKHFAKKIIDPKQKYKKHRKIQELNIKSGIFPKYLLEFTLVVPEPESIDQFDSISNQLYNHFTTIIKQGQLSNITSVNFESQMLYTVDFEQEPDFDRNNQVYTFPIGKLPHLISGLEQFMTNLETDSKILRFLLYFTPSHKSPLYILNEKGSNATGNSFNVMNWGGVLVVNKQNPEKFTLDQSILNVLYSQVIESIGFDSRIRQDDQAWLTQLSKSALLADWQIRRLKLEATLDYCMGAIATVNSLDKLLASITNIVINDHVARDLEKAVIEALRCVKLLNREFGTFEYLEQAHQAALLAREKSEQAFYDESLLALLYFPDDQKYAIYVPLFLPVLLPILLSLKFVVKYFKGVDVE